MKNNDSSHLQPYGSPSEVRSLPPEFNTMVSLLSHFCSLIQVLLSQQQLCSLVFHCASAHPEAFSLPPCPHPTLPVVQLLSRHLLLFIFASVPPRGCHRENIMSAVEHWLCSRSSPVVLPFLFTFLAIQRDSSEGCETPRSVRMPWFPQVYHWHKIRYRDGTFSYFLCHDLLAL